MNPEVDKQQQKFNEFIRLLPLTLALAGLPECELGRHFTETQLESRATTLKLAYKIARQLVMDITK
ncbi:MAG: hypothetical protein FJ303_18640 [Planctomycetes bacterium]|nr:hypothetical protein [Planctomycetota bacterium]